MVDSSPVNIVLHGLCQENDCRSTFGLNIRNIYICNETIIFLRGEKFVLKYFPINEKDNWRTKALKEWKQVRAIEGFSEDKIKEMIEYIACN